MFVVYLCNTVVSNMAQCDAVLQLWPEKVKVHASLLVFSPAVTILDQQLLFTLASSSPCNPSSP